MKLQNFIVIFIIIIIPLIIVYSYYTGLQKETIAEQTKCNTRLLQSVKQAMQAYEVNTVKWNSGYSSLSDSKRRDISASINTFIQSLSNGMRVTGLARESISTYIPAIAYTMYDGLYIYSPSNVPVTVTDDDGITQTDEDGNILYETETGGTTTNISAAKMEYRHVLKDLMPYSEFIKENGNEIIINYTLDNYVRLVIHDINNAIIEKEGYLSFFRNISFDTYDNKIIEKISYQVDGGTTVDIEPEILSERIVYYNAHHVLTNGIFTYIYDENKEKLYFDSVSGQFFMLSSKGDFVYLNSQCNAGDSNCKYKMTYMYEGGDNFTKVYQVLNGVDKGTIYDSTKAVVIEANTSTRMELNCDYSAINYVVESYKFTDYIHEILPSGNPIYIRANNRPDVSTSAFNRHKEEIMKQTITDNLVLAITSYGANSDYKFSLPVMTEEDWNHIYHNITMIAFLQGLPIGLKTYNSYALAASTENKEYVNPNEIYYMSNDTYCHRKNCPKIQHTDDGIKGYRNIEFSLRSFANSEDVLYYYLHNRIEDQPLYLCYNCLITAYYKEISPYDDEESSIRLQYLKAYNEAIARERYVS